MIKILVLLTGVDDLVQHLHRLPGLSGKQFIEVHSISAYIDDLITDNLEESGHPTLIAEIRRVRPDDAGNLNDVSQMIE